MPNLEKLFLPMQPPLDREDGEVTTVEPKEMSFELRQELQAKLAYLATYIIDVRDLRR